MNRPSVALNVTNATNTNAVQFGAHTTHHHNTLRTNLKQMKKERSETSQPPP